jgi:hypothetical protein
MNFSTVKSVGRFLFWGIVFISLPIGVFFTFRFFMARLITKDNAQAVLDQFQAALDKGAIVRDGNMASDVAANGYREIMHGIPVDGWGNPFRIDGTVHGDNIDLTVKSAGPDGAFGTSDDVQFTRTFENKDRKFATTH